MKIFRAILIGALIWFFGVLSYLMVPSIPFFEDLGLQANSVLAIVILPLVWFGLSLYYKKRDATHGYEIGEAMLLTCVALDALITVPFTIIPAGGSYYSFFTSFDFWFIAFEFIAVAVIYWRIMVKPKLENNLIG
ncbi:hypothetical protein FVB32_08730 [Flagellimonas hymeniacidonis]|uniref:Uncharacterized protein n=1 Tax=Flagellimonas hymeniacidonis TaxID=2603628 RepID=A0A5C8VAE8_9FLAO|nr:DUF5367 family protein [Flagellimonas hymeniacidonis]TXN38363.1 hypothetical protein FVB32_08730 [Flagellimonas hymeniacidonis]